MSSTARPSAAPLSKENQQKLLAIAINNVREHSIRMKRSLDENQWREALEHSIKMLQELHTDKLTPDQYYELSLLTNEQLAYLEIYLLNQDNRTPLENLYEIVQYCGNIVPRLYLLVTVGTAFLKTNKTVAKEILTDMVEMCRGVQHPTRGLFLRNYLLQRTKNELPDIDSNTSATVEDSIQFILINLVEMNKLWVRMQFQGHTRDRERIEAERSKLRVLVGFNLECLSRLEGLNLPLYKEKVLPQVLKQVVDCRDPIAQEYLMEVVTRVFPDELHLQTLEEFMKTCPMLTLQVDLRHLITAMIDRLAAFTSSADKAQLAGLDVPIFDIFLTNIRLLIESRQELPPSDIFSILGSLAKLALALAPGDLTQVDHIFQLALAKLKVDELTSLKADRQATSELHTLLSTCFELASSPLDLVSVENLHTLFAFLPMANRRKLATRFAETFLPAGHRLRSHDAAPIEAITTKQTAGHVFTFLEPLIKLKPAAAAAARVAEGHPPADEEDDDDFDAEDVEYASNLLARLVLLLKSDNFRVHYALLNQTRKFLADACFEQINRILPSFVFASLSVIHGIFANRSNDDEWENQCIVFLKFAVSCTKAISTAVRDMGSVDRSSITPAQVMRYHSQTINLYLQIALMADRCSLEDYVYEVFTQVGSIYEKAISDSQIQVSTLVSMVSTLQATRSLSSSNYTKLIRFFKNQASGMLQSSNRTLCLMLSSHLAWQQEDTPAVPKLDFKSNRVHDSAGCRKILNETVQSHVESSNLSVNITPLVRILDRYVYYAQTEFPDTDESKISTLIKMIRDQFNSPTSLVEDDQDDHADTYEESIYCLQKAATSKQHFNRIIKYLHTVSHTSESDLATFKQPASMKSISVEEYLE
ncbi:hypothetical protein H696_01743 [Fonticula alba]|uniref:Vacuolar protein sorting-associated protein 35 n=1 Tax=Fonticula alba TaxID=691883 RepID=A0A058ZD64_FONAL|nr:hypothetical protein H696_01743 [Fonticula alba]KCV72350.1 hypothetical protein H696_01743 [Fonticula alba]|eukprot:XP_009493928.1 hypothetical protein H696_01743 [Fonticula alba]